MVSEKEWLLPMEEKFLARRRAKGRKKLSVSSELRHKK